jgi:hypothetical protein
MKEKLIITLKDLDDIKGVLKSLELLFQKLIIYYGEKDAKKLNTLVMSCGVYFGKILRLMGYSEEDFEELE